MNEQMIQSTNQSAHPDLQLLCVCPPTTCSPPLGKQERSSFNHSISTSISFSISIRQTTASSYFPRIRSQPSNQATQQPTNKQEREREEARHTDPTQQKLKSCLSLSLSLPNLSNTFDRSSPTPTSTLLYPRPLTTKQRQSKGEAKKAGIRPHGRDAHLGLETRD